LGKLGCPAKSRNCTLELHARLCIDGELSKPTKYNGEVIYLFILFYFTRFAAHTNINTTKPLHNITYFTYITGRD
jgi:hypothetical protein